MEGLDQAMSFDEKAKQMSKFNGKERRKSNVMALKTVWDDPTKAYNKQTNCCINK